MKTFSDILGEYLEEVGCSASEMARVSGVQKANISRYLSGSRVPGAGSTIIINLAAALAVLSGGKLDEQAVFRTLDDAIRQEENTLLPERLETVLDAFGVAHNRLARSMDFDPSYISRILSGKRHPADPAAFIDGVVSYIVRNYADADGIAIAARLTGMPENDLSSTQQYASAIRRFLGSDSSHEKPTADAAGSFLQKLDDFNLNEFLKSIRFDDIKIPTAPFQLPTTRVYEGIEQMKKAELDFLKAAVLSKSTEDVILYSDMPLSEMADDKEFPKKVMQGIALLARKGVHLQNIHNVHRPLSEMLMGLEGWLPLYLSGQMSSYYLPYATNDVFLHFLRSAETVAVTGEAIAGNQGGGRYVVTKNPGDVAYARRRAKELLALARPLISVYRADEKRKLAIALNKLESKTDDKPTNVGAETFKNVEITVWPKSHALIRKSDANDIVFLVEHPSLVEAFERYKPTLF